MPETSTSLPDIVRDRRDTTVTPVKWTQLLPKPSLILYNNRLIAGGALNRASADNAWRRRAFHIGILTHVPLGKSRDPSKTSCPHEQDYIVKPSKRRMCHPRRVQSGVAEIVLEIRAAPALPDFLRAICTKTAGRIVRLCSCATQIAHSRVPPFPCPAASPMMAGGWWPTSPSHAPRG